MSSQIVPTCNEYNRRERDLQRLESRFFPLRQPVKGVWLIEKTTCQRLRVEREQEYNRCAAVAEAHDGVKCLKSGPLKQDPPKGKEGFKDA